MCKKLEGSQLKKFKEGLCIEPFCRKKHRPKYRLCYKHLQRKYRANHPVMASYHNLKAHAKYRGKEFSLTYEQFAGIDKESNYVANTGPTAESATLDRIRNDEGYHINNIQVISRSENSHKHVNYCPF